MSARLSLRHIPRFAYYLFTELRDDRGAGLAQGQLVGASLGFLPLPPREWKENGVYDSGLQEKGIK